MAISKRDIRLGLYRKIEVARKQLPAMDEVAFRSLLRAEFGVESRKDMTVNQLSRLVHYFTSNLGVKYKAPAKSRNNRVTPHGRPDFIEITDSMPFAAQKRQILAIWRKLGYSMSSLDTRVKREFGTDCFVWLQDGEKIKALLTDLQHREKALDKKQPPQGGRRTPARGGPNPYGGETANGFAPRKQSEIATVAQAKMGADVN